MRWSRIGLSWDRFAVVAVLLLLLGAALRLWLLVDVSPAFLGYPDSGGYMAAAATRLSASGFQPVGYVVFLRMGHLISGRLAFTVLVQHLLGLATAVLYVDGVRRVARVRWVALIPMVVVLFDGLQLFFEHTVMSEVVFVALVAAAMNAAARLLDGPWLPWTVLMAVACGLAVAVRAVALPLIVVVLVWLALVRPTAIRRFLPAAAALAVSVFLVGIYVVDNHSRNGVWGLTKADAFNPYLRVASFAHCVGWRAPAGTQTLCSRRIPPPALWKPGPFVWACLLDPGVCQFGDPPDASSKLRAFTTAAIWHQPGDYISAVATDVGHFVVPPHGASQGDLLRLLHSSFWVPPNVHQMASYYSERNVASTASSPPVAYALAVHSTGGTIAILIVLGLASIPLCRGRERALTVLLAATGLTLLVASVVTATYQPRYALPALAPLSAASALALSGAITRIHEHGTRQRGVTGPGRQGVPGAAPP